MRPLFILTLLAPFLVLVPHAAAQRQKKAPAITWDLKRLDEDPVRLIKAVHGLAGGRTAFVVELTRTVNKPSEVLEWERGDPFVFRFLDEDEVVLKTVRPQLDGELVREKGRRFRLVVSLPEERILARTKKVLVE